MNEKTLQALSECELLSELSRDDLERIAERVRTRTFQPKQEIVSYNDEDRDVFFILDGWVRANVLSRDGKEVAFRDMDAGSVFGEISAIDSGPRSANVTAITTASIAAMDPVCFNEMLRDHPAVATAMLQKMAHLVRALSERVFEFTAPVPTRVCSELLRMARQHMIGDNIARLVPAPKHGDVASRIGTHREAVSRTMGELRERKIVRRGQGELLITDVAGLENLVTGDDTRN